MSVVAAGRNASLFSGSVAMLLGGEAPKAPLPSTTSIDVSHRSLSRMQVSIPAPKCGSGGYTDLFRPRARRVVRVPLRFRYPV